jgi:Protein of unknown function (DUF2958)
MLPINRPDSWNFKMINGEPLVSDAQFEQLLANGLEWGSGTPPKTAPPVVKIFLPYVRWYLVALDADLDTAFAVVDDVRKLPMFGTLSLADIVASRLGMLQPERDMYIKLNQPWTYYHEEFVCRATNRGKAVR